MNVSLPRLLILLMLLAPAVLAQETTPSDVVDQTSEQSTDESVDQTAEEQVAHEQAAADAMADEAKERVQQLLRDSAGQLANELAVRSESVGPYDVSLAELQRDLGRIYLELGEYELATDVLQQALQLLRIDRGLYDASQIPVLEQLVASYRGQSDWDSVDDYQHLVFSLQTRAYQPDSPEFADAVLAMGDWQVVSARANRSGRGSYLQSVESLRDLRELYDSVNVHARARGDVARQWELLYATALVEVEIARQYLAADTDDFMVSASRYVSQTICRTVSDGNGGYQRVCWQESVSNPDYFRQVNNQRDVQLRRVRMSLQTAQEDMQSLMDAHPDFARSNSERAQTGMQNLAAVQQNLERELNRSTLGSIW